MRTFKYRTTGNRTTYHNQIDGGTARIGASSGPFIRCFHSERRAPKRSLFKTVDQLANRAAVLLKSRANIRRATAGGLLNVIESSQRSKVISSSRICESFGSLGTLRDTFKCPMLSVCVFGANVTHFCAVLAVA